MIRHDTFYEEQQLWRIEMALSLNQIERFYKESATHHRHKDGAVEFTFYEGDTEKVSAADIKRYNLYKAKVMNKE